MTDSETPSTPSISTPQPELWWLARVEDLLVWARLELMPAGSARVLDSSGQWLVYDSPDSARAALLDANFFAIDGLDETDAEQLGLMLAAIEPPPGDSEAYWLPQMTQFLGKN